MEHDKASFFSFNISELPSPKLPTLYSPSPHMRAPSISKNSDSKYILSNSIDENFFTTSPKNIKKLRTPRLQSIYLSPLSNELCIALKHISPKKIKKPKPPKKQMTIRYSSISKVNIENDIKTFIQSIFSHEPSPYRKIGITSEPGALDIRAGEKILQEAKKIIKHGVFKKPNDKESVSSIEEF